MSGLTFASVYDELASNPALSAETVRRVFDSILSGEWTAVQVAGFIASLRLRGETPEIIAAAAQSLRGAMIRVEHSLPRVLDTCGTGGDGSGSLNLSTGAAIIAAAAGVPVAKHGNRAVSSRAGSADVIEALGVPVDLPATAASEVLAEANIAFMLAPTHHPAMRHAMQARRELGIRTIFNCLGPLANPALATHQLLGAPDDKLRRMLGETLRSLGSRRAWVVHGADGLDEVSPFGPTRVTQLSAGALEEFEVRPEDFGIERAAPGAITGGDAAFNAAVLEQVLRGESHPATDAFILNAAAALVVADEAPPQGAAERAREAIRSGAALRTLESWRAAALRRRPATEA